MKLAINLSLFLFTLVTLGEESFSLTDYKIKKICRAAKKELICIRKLQEKRSDLNKGNLIEIPVIKYKGR